MAKAKEGQAFIQHEFDEAIAVQRAIVEAERVLSKAHPMSKTRTAMVRLVKIDKASLRALTKLGKRFGATGKAEEVAAAMKELSATTNESAKEAPSEAYEAHAVLLTMLRKQQDSAGAMAKIATKMGDTEVTVAATEMQQSSKAGADELAKLLSQLAVQIATKGAKPKRIAAASR